MKVLIVEDEPILREGLIRKIDWKQLDLKLAGVAGDGFDAMSQLVSCNPDIVLTDVRMPGMDGLQFIRQARVDYPLTKFVIISGFNEFECVREALQYSVKDYLLKPVDKEKLHSLLSGLCQELREERQEAADRSKLNALNQIIKQSNLQPLDFQLTHLASEQADRWDGVPASLAQCRYYAGASVQIVYRTDNSRFKENEEPLARFAVQNIIVNALKPLDLESIVFKHAYHSKEIVIFLGSDRALELRGIADHLSETLVWARNHLGLIVSIGIGLVKDKLPQLRLSCMEARKVLKNRLLFGNGNVYLDTQGDLPQTVYAPLTKQAESVLSSMLEEGNHGEFLDFASQLFRSLAESPESRNEQLEYLYAEIIHMLRRHAAKTATHLPNWSIGTPIASLENMTDWRDIIGTIEQQLRRLSIVLDRGADRSCDDIIGFVQQHIQQHYAENLSLQWVADTYYIHPNYFSKRFKSAVGISFNDYITRVRIDRSKELLRTTTLKIARISQLVGYEDQNYFCNVFKKVTGTSPTAYRG